MACRISEGMFVIFFPRDRSMDEKGTGVGRRQCAMRYGQGERSTTQECENSHYLDAVGQKLVLAFGYLRASSSYNTREFL